MLSMRATVLAQLSPGAFPSPSRMLSQDPLQSAHSAQRLKAAAGELYDNKRCQPLPV